MKTMRMHFYCGFWTFDVLQPAFFLSSIIVDYMMRTQDEGYREVSDMYREGKKSETQYTKYR